MVNLAQSTVPTAHSKLAIDHHLKANVQKALDSPFVKKHPALGSYVVLQTSGEKQFVSTIILHF